MQKKSIKNRLEFEIFNRKIAHSKNVIIKYLEKGNENINYRVSKNFLKKSTKKIFSKSTKYPINYIFIDTKTCLKKSISKLKYNCAIVNQFIINNIKNISFTSLYFLTKFTLMTNKKNLIK